jgi:hypothetical protein
VIPAPLGFLINSVFPTQVIWWSTACASYHRYRYDQNGVCERMLFCLHKPAGRHPFFKYLNIYLLNFYHK